MHGLNDETPAIEVWKDAAKTLSAADPVLARVIKQVGKSPHIHIVGDPFEALMLGVIRQQRNASAAKSIVDKLAAMTDGKLPNAGQVIEIGPTQLHDAGLPRDTANDLWELARMAVERRIDFDSVPSMNDDEAIDYLSTLPRIGSWTAKMYLIFSLARPDVFLGASDVSLKKAVTRMYELDHEPTSAELEAIADKWRPFRSAAAWYLWTASGDFTPGLK